jgi:hypothetical protein
MQLDLHVVEMALAEATELGVDHATGLAPGARGNQSRGYISDTYSLSVFQHPDVGLLGACDRASGVFVHAQHRWSLEELDEQTPYWDLRARPAAMSPVQPRDVLRIAHRYLLSDDLGRMGGAVTVLDSMRPVRLLVPLIGRDGDDIVAANPFERASTGRLVHDGLSRILSGMPPYAVDDLRDRLPDLRAGRELDLGLHWSYRQLCAEELRDLRARLAAGGRTLVRAAAGELVFAFTRRAIAAEAELDALAEILDGRTAIEGALSGLAARSRMGFLDNNMRDAVDAISAHLSGKPTCLSAVILSLLAMCQAGRHFAGDTANAAEYAVACADEADDALHNYVAAGDFSAVDDAGTRSWG